MKPHLDSPFPIVKVVCLVLAVTQASLPLSGRAQYSINWFTIGGGGGTSASGDGRLSLSGTIGQSDAGAMASNGGHFQLSGGFWTLYPAQTSGAPFPSIARTATNTVVITWPSSSEGWVLQQNASGVSSVNWSNVNATIQDDGMTKTLVVSPPTGNRFYRLFKP